MRALVTGGAKRLGREISVYLANRGYDVAVHYNSSKNEALDVAKEINSQGRLSECLKCDLLIEDQVKALGRWHLRLLVVQSQCWSIMLQYLNMTVLMMLPVLVGIVTWRVT